MPNQFVRSAIQAIDIEIEAIKALRDRIDGDFSKACQLLLDCQGKVIVTGMGKSGHIGSKIAATLASTGTPAFFVHPGEASHGDLGMISPADSLIAISNSGESDEIVTLLPVLQRLGVPVIAMTGNPSSTLAKAAKAHLHIGVAREACPLGLAPTASTTATLVMGDALAVALLEAKGFNEADFALSHPGGSLGRRLLLTVSDVMHQGETLPLVNRDTALLDALMVISQKGLGMTAVVNEQQQLLGIFTDGDLRRAIDQHVDLHSANIGELMIQNPVTVPSEMLAVDALRLMKQRRINGLMVVDEHQYVKGALNMQDMLRAGVVL